jgi:hypothetical protein
MVPIADNPLACSTLFSLISTLAVLRIADFQIEIIRCERSLRATALNLLRRPVRICRSPSTATLHTMLMASYMCGNELRFDRSGTAATDIMPASNPSTLADLPIKVLRDSAVRQSRCCFAQRLRLVRVSW